MKRVLVTDGGERASLAIVRSLGQAEYDVHVTAMAPGSLAGGSRFVVAEHVAADPMSSPEASAGDVRAIIEREGIDILVPTTEASLLSLLPLKTELPNLCVPSVGLATFRAVCDKTRVFEVAGELGIDVPRQVVLAGPEASEAAVGDLDLPVVIKPSRSVVDAEDGQRKLTVAYADSLDELRDMLRRLPGAAFPVNVQERITGPGTGVFLLIRDGAVAARFAHKRLREQPPSGGVSVYCESVAPDEELVDAATRLLSRFDWEGVAMVEFKRDADTGRPYLMEINGRFWGSLQLAVDAGVDFPRLLIESALGETPKPVLEYRAGVRLRWTWGTVDHLLARLRRSREQLFLPASEPGRVGAVARFAGSLLRGRDEVFRWADPVPSVRETLRWFRSLGGSGTPRGQETTS